MCAYECVCVNESVCEYIRTYACVCDESQGECVNFREHASVCVTLFIRAYERLICAYLYATVCTCEYSLTYVEQDAVVTSVLTPSCYLFTVCLSVCLVLSVCLPCAVCLSALCCLSVCLVLSVWLPCAVHLFVSDCL